MASVASVYIGEWAAGVKQGYGIMDDIMTGNYNVITNRKRNRCSSKIKSL